MFVEEGIVQRREGREGRGLSSCSLLLWKTAARALFPPPPVAATTTKASEDDDEDGEEASGGDGAPSRGSPASRSLEGRRGRERGGAAPRGRPPAASEAIFLEKREKKK